MPKITSLIVAAIIALAAGVSQSSAAEITLRVHHFLGSDSLPQTALIEPWAKRIEADSNGRIKVEIHPDMELGGHAPDLIDQVVKGTVDIIWTAAAYTPKRFMRTTVFTLPLVHINNPVATNLAIRDLFASDLAPEYKGIHPLVLHVHQGHALHMATRPVYELADLKGMVIRPPGRQIGAWTVEALGAQTTKKRHPKLPKALKNSELDGTLMSFRLAESMGVVDAVKYHTVLPGNSYFGTSIYMFLMNEKRYKSLPGDLRAVIDKNSGRELAIMAGRAWEDAGNKAQKAASWKANQIIELEEDSQSLLVLRLEKIWDRYVKMLEPSGIDARKLIAKARAAVKANSK